MNGLMANAATTFGHTANVSFNPSIVLLLPQCEGMDVSNSLEVGSEDTSDCKKRVVGADVKLYDMDRDLQQRIQKCPTLWIKSK